MTRRLTPENRARLEEHRREVGRARDHRERQRRAETPRAHTLAANRYRVSDLVRLRLENDREEEANPPPPRPRTRGECVNGPRPCPWVCAHSLLYEVTERGGLKVLHPDANGGPDPDYVGPSCSLDVADAGPHTLEEVGAYLNIGRERARQTEAAALAKLRASRLRELADESEPLGRERVNSAWPW